MAAITESLALRLLRIIFGSYFIVTLTVTCLQLLADYRHTKARVESEIKAMEQTFGPGISNSMWRFQDEVQKGILNGISNLPIVTGVKIEDNKGRLIHAVGTVLDPSGKQIRLDAGGQSTPVKVGFFDEAISHSFPIQYRDEQGTTHHIGKWTVYSNQQVVVKQIEYGFFLILVNSVIKTTILWFIFLYVFQRWLGKPITRLSDFVRQRDLNKLDDQKFELPGEKRHELHFLADAINAMLSRLQHSLIQNSELYTQLEQEKESLHQLNTTLEQRIAERTQDLQTANARLELLSQTDGLTGIANRRHFDTVFAGEWRRAIRSGTPLAVAMIDVDWFKKYNDHYGHPAGDAVLRQVAQTLQKTVCRASDLVARYGGEEFVFIAPNTDAAQALVFARKVCDAIFALQIPHALSDYQKVSASIGVVSWVPAHDQDMSDLLEAADAALYKAKMAGRNQAMGGPP